MSYRDTIVWAKSLEMAVLVYQLASALPREEIFGIRSQITRAASSVPCNIAEGWCRATPRDKAHFMTIAHGSLAELETLITICERMGWFSLDSTAPVRLLLDETGRMVTALRRRFRDGAATKRLRRNSTKP